MSVVLRVMNGKNYIHVRRKINGTQKQHFTNISNMSRSELAKSLIEARKIDREWKGEQMCLESSLVSLFCTAGKLNHIRLAAPSKKEGASIKCLIARKDKVHSFHTSRSINKHGLNGAIEKVFRLMSQNLGVNPDSVVGMLMLSLYKSSLKMAYLEQISK
ncbi:hypothetical protein [Psychromonas sp. SP041]|uniref:hypothetical protein n=1 Tax=Psychromonas sp. SP041 TaxID=1365007 RepID=UPI0010C7895D|nr:hypothetical protein [Psychromonas sp. SP041]